MLSTGPSTSGACPQILMLSGVMPRVLDSPVNRLSGLMYGPPAVARRAVARGGRRRSALSRRVADWRRAAARVVSVVASPTVVVVAPSPVPLSPSSVVGPDAVRRRRRGRRVGGRQRGRVQREHERPDHQYGADADRRGVVAGRLQHRARADRRAARARPRAARTPRGRRRPRGRPRRATPTCVTVRTRRANRGTRPRRAGSRATAAGGGCERCRRPCRGFSNISVRSSVLRWTTTATTATVTSWRLTSAHASNT